MGPFLGDLALAASVQGLFAGPFGTPFFVFCARWLPLLVAGVSIVAAVAEHEPNRRHAWKELFWSVGVAFAASLCLAALIGRTRPFLAAGSPVLGLVSPPASTFAFPSTHAAVLWAWAVAATAIYRPAAPLWFFCALLVALARVVVGVHFVTDVVFGAFLGIGAWQLVRFGHRRLRKPAPAYEA